MPKAKTKPAPATPKPSAAGEHVAVRLPPATLVRLDAEAARMRALIPGLNVTRSAALRAVIDRGLDAPPALAVKV